jgi:hypothetical protein
MFRWCGILQPRRFSSACSRVNVAIAENAQGTVAVKRQLAKAPTLRPVLPGGACAAVQPRPNSKLFAINAFQSSGGLPLSSIALNTA